MGTAVEPDPTTIALARTNGRAGAAEAFVVFGISGDPANSLAFHARHLVKRGW